MQDNTQVRIQPLVDIVGSSTVSAAPAGMPAEYLLSKGQILQFTQAGDLTGSFIESNFLVGLWGAHTCMNIDASTPFCDSAHQQLPRLTVSSSDIADTALGDEYVGVRYRNRTTAEETPPWRLVGITNGTSLTWDPPIAGAPTTLTSGQLAIVTTAGPFRVSSQDAAHPFYLFSHMTGAGPFNDLGDPEFVSLVPPRAWRNGYTFFTQPGFPETSLVVVRSSASGGFRDVNLDCAGNLGGWSTMDSLGLYQYARIDLSAATSSARTDATTVCTPQRAPRRSPSRCGVGATRRRAPVM